MNSKGVILLILYHDHFEHTRAHTNLYFIFKTCTQLFIPPEHCLFPLNSLYDHFYPAIVTYSTMFTINTDRGNGHLLETQAVVLNAAEVERERGNT